MNCEQKNCWCCLWHTAYGTGKDAILRCRHSSRQIRDGFSDCSTARTCKAYLEDEPGMKINIERDTRETLMMGIHKLVVDNEHFHEAEKILDYFKPEMYDSPKTITCDDFCVVTEVQFGGSEGIYLDCYAEGRIQPDAPEKRWCLGTYKTLESSLDAMQTFGALGGALTYYARQYLIENGRRFLTDRELRVRYLKERQKAEEANAQ